jgi:methylated-DNA-protein-cysteine methyltransferase-like protein
MKTGRRKSGPVFTSPPAREAFNNVVWELVARIPRGKVLTYGGIAAMIPRPTEVRARYYRAAAARWIGSALAACPPVLPWHRVINSRGKISIRAGNDHHRLQRKLLEREGVEFNKSGKIDLRRFLWIGPKD